METKDIIKNTNKETFKQGISAYQGLLEGVWLSFNLCTLEETMANPEIDSKLNSIRPKIFELANEFRQLQRILEKEW